MHLSILMKSIIVVLIVASSGIALFAQGDVARQTTAITYPLDERVTVQFRGTTRFPRMKGDAKVQRTGRSGTRIELNVEKMPRPFELGPGYATYVVWAISPEGQIDNLGEIKRSGFSLIDSKINVTTTFQTFALIITAEPHFLVTRPSQVIMMENLAPVASRGRRVATVAAVQYFGNSSDYFRDPRTPEIAEADYSRTPPAILQAKQAVGLARFAGADRDATEELAEAETLLQNAENAWRAGRDNDTIDIAARRSISAAVRAESLAFERKAARDKRNEQLRNDAEIRTAENRIQSAQNEVSDLRAELARETRNRELAERDSLNFSNQVKDLRAENGRLREELGRAKVEIETANARAAAVEREKNTVQEERDREANIARIRAAETELMAALRNYGTVAKTDRGITLTMAESIWSGPRAPALTAAANGRITALGALLADHRDYRITVESHTDNTGEPTAIQALTDRRAYIVAEKFAENGVEEGRIMARGLGATLPVAPNTTNANKAKNRRVQVTLALFNEGN
jgi:outer membrane protein OmpA-like peptidoglycan-associated protein